MLYFQKYLYCKTYLTMYCISDVQFLAQGSKATTQCFKAFEELYFYVQIIPPYWLLAVKH